MPRTEQNAPADGFQPPLIRTLYLSTSNPQFKRLHNTMDLVDGVRSFTGVTVLEN